MNTLVKACKVSEVSRIAFTIQLLFGTLAATAPERALADEPQNQSEITVIASGTGADEKAALKQAFSNAVTQAVGTIVDAETVVKDDQIITDQILTASNAIITRYDPIGKPSVEQGLVTVKIRAVVERKQLTDRLLAAKVISARVEGEDLFAQIVTELQNEKDSSVVVRRVFEGFPANVVKLEPIGKPEVVKRGEAQVTLAETIRVSIDNDRYGEWIKSFLPVLTRAATASEDKWWSPDNAGIEPLEPKSDLLSSDNNERFATIPRDVRTRTLAVNGRGHSLIRALWIPGWSSRQCIVISEKQGGTKITLLQLSPSAMREAVEATLRVPIGHIVLKDDLGAAVNGLDVPLVYTFSDPSMTNYFSMKATPYWAIDEGSMRPSLGSAAGDARWQPEQNASRNFHRRHASLLICPYFGTDEVATPAFDYKLLFRLSLDDLQRVKTVEASVSQREFKLPRDWVLDEAGK